MPRDDRLDRAFAAGASGSAAVTTKEAIPPLARASKAGFAPGDNGRSSAPRRNKDRQTRFPEKRGANQVGEILRTPERDRRPGTRSGFRCGWNISRLSAGHDSWSPAHDTDAPSFCTPVLLEHAWIVRDTVPSP